jgi:hypothetical protein
MNLGSLWDDLAAAGTWFISAANYVPVQDLVSSHLWATTVVVVVALVMGWLSRRLIAKVARRLLLAVLSAGLIVAFWPALGAKLEIRGIADASGSDVVALTVTILGAWLLLSAAGRLFWARLRLGLLGWTLNRL